MTISQRFRSIFKLAAVFLMTFALGEGTTNVVNGDIVDSGGFLTATALTDGSGPTDSLSIPGNPPGSMGFVSAGTNNFPEVNQSQASLTVGHDPNSPEGLLGAHSFISGATTLELLSTSMVQQTTQWQVSSTNGSPVGIDVGLALDGYLLHYAGGGNPHADVGLTMELGLPGVNTTVYSSTAHLDGTSGLTVTSSHAEWLDSFTANGPRRFDMDYTHNINDLFFIQDGDVFSITTTLSTEAYALALETGAESNFLNTLSYSISTNTVGGSVFAVGVPEPAAAVLMIPLLGVVMLRRR